MLLQILEDSRLTDSTGRVVSFKNTVIILTSNVGAKLITDTKKLGFTGGNGEDPKVEYEKTKKDIMQEVKKEFRPEFINRIDEIIVFQKLQDQDLMQIVDLMLTQLLKRLEDQGILIDIDQSIKEYIIKQENDKNYGARPLRRAVQNIVEDSITDAILSGEIKTNTRKTMKRIQGKIVFE